MLPETAAIAGAVLPRRKLLSHLMHLRDQNGSLSTADLEHVAALFGLSRAEVYEVASFYPALEWPYRPAARPAVDLSCWLSCREDEDGRDAWPCRGRCARRLIFTRSEVAGGRPLRYVRWPAQELVTAAREWPRNLSIAGKWPAVINGTARPILIANADEGDPTACKDRFLLETDPQGVLEAALVAASALNACELIFCVNGEYACAIAALQNLLSLHAAELSAFNLSIERSGGAYICGEETALVASLEGFRGVPRERPYDLTRRGFLGRPTLVHNVESLYRLSALVGATPDARLVTTQLLDPRIDAVALTGRVSAPSLGLLSWEGSLRDLIAASGGMRDGYELAGVVIGGMLGGIVTGDHLDVPRTTLQGLGYGLGPGSIVAFSQRDSVRDIVQIMANFHAAESCGHCTPCRDGTARAVELLAQGGARECELDDLAFVMREASACGLGRGAGRVLAQGLKLCRGLPTCR